MTPRLAVTYIWPTGEHARATVVHHQYGIVHPVHKRGRPRSSSRAPRSLVSSLKALGSSGQGTTCCSVSGSRPKLKQFVPVMGVLSGACREFAIIVHPVHHGAQPLCPLWAHYGPTMRPLCALYAPSRRPLCTKKIAKRKFFCPFWMLSQKFCLLLIQNTQQKN